jgi:hypothetical protein
MKRSIVVTLAAAALSGSLLALGAAAALGEEAATVTMDSLTQFFFYNQ